MDKRGLAHIEVILSFVLFIVAVGFAFYYFNPFVEKNTDKNVIDKLIDTSESNVNIYGIIIDNSLNQIGAPPNNLTIAVRIQSEKNASVLHNSEIINSKSGNSYIYFSVPWSEKDFVYLIESEDIIPLNSAMGNPGHNQLFYKIGSMQKLDVVSELNILKIQDEYKNNYENLKKKLGIEKNDFTFRITFENQTLGGIREISSGRDVFAESKSIKILTKNGGIKTAVAETKIW